MVLSYVVVAVMLWMGIPTPTLVATVASFGVGYLLKARETNMLRYEIGELRRSLCKKTEQRRKEILQIEH
ncbi:small membrane protein [Marseillevirus marseillevirus]|uniref:Small membrane protein n=1 Tax=Marseillevirus marseillevirus TaxID=694581 RepID=D2XAG9_GBMV|nr:small membrane protein [Marseillevirus marseillevirus]ADB03946.1 small membrane protein [Marseillevirus marseillevirus]